MRHIACLLLLAVQAPLIGAAPGAPSGTEAGYRYNNAARCFQEGDYDGTIKAVRDYVALDPGNAEKRRFAVRLLIRMAEETRSRRRHDQALRLLVLARSLEDNEKVKALAIAVREESETGPTVRPEPPKRSDDGTTLSGWFLSLTEVRAESPASSPASPESPAEPAERKQGPGRPRPRAKTAAVPVEKKRPVPENPRISAAAPVSAPAKRPERRGTPAGTAAALAAAAAAAAVFAVLYGTQKRLLRDSARRLGEMRRMLEDERTRLKKEQERMTMALEERLESGKQKIEAETRRRQADWEREAEARREAWKAAEPRRPDPAAAGPHEAAQLNERTPPPASVPTDAGGQAPPHSESREAARLAAYEALSSRLRAFRRFAQQLKDIYGISGPSAADPIETLLNDPDHRVRAYLAGGLAHVPAPESAYILLRLWKDESPQVREEVLRGLFSFYQQNDFERVFPEHLQSRIRRLVELEKRGDEWIF